MKINKTVLTLVFAVVFGVSNLLTPAAQAQGADASIESQLQPSGVPGVFVDHRGEEWIRVSDGEQNFRFIELKNASTEEIVKTFAQFNFRGIPLQSLKALPVENMKFSAAMFLVQMTTCFGGNISPLTFSSQSSLRTPTCVDDFLHHLVDWKGWVSFYAFMVGNRYTSQTLMKVTLLAAEHVGNPRSIPALRAKLQPLYGYLGMAGGSLASQVVSHFLNAPSWGQCIELMSEEGLGSLPCREAFTHFLSVEGFWDDFTASTASMISSSVAAHFTQQLITKSPQLFNQAFQAGAKGFQVLGGDDRALSLVRSAGSKAIQAVRVGKTLVMASGVPGVVIWVSTEIGTFVLFLAWEEVLRVPFQQGYHDLTKSSKVKEGLEKITDAVTAYQNDGWRAPLVEKTTHCVNHRISRTEFKRECTDQFEEHLAVGLSLLDFGATTYRKKVLIPGLDEKTYNWQNKTSMFMGKYRVLKMITEHIHRERTTPQSLALNATGVAQVVAAAWAQALTEEITLESVARTRILEQIVLLGELVQKQNSLTSPDEALSLANIENAPSILVSLAKKWWNVYVRSVSIDPQIRAQYKVLRETAFQNLGMIQQNSMMMGCLATPRLCKAIELISKIDIDSFPSQPTGDSLGKNIEFLENLIGVFGPELVQESFYEIMCGHSDQFQFDNMGNNGRRARMTAPLFPQISDDHMYQLDNCSDIQKYPIFHFKTEDLTRIWWVDGKIYSDPLSVLIDSQIRLVSGNSEAEAAQWWQTNAFPPASEFMRNMTINYQELLRQEVFGQIPQMTAENLVLRTRPRMRGPELEHFIVTLQLDMWNRPTLAESLMGQTTFLADNIAYRTPDFPRKRELLDSLKLQMAQYILDVNHQVDNNAITTQWADYDSDIRSAGSDMAAMDQANSEFSDLIQEIALGSVKREQIRASRENLMKTVGEIYFGLSGTRYDDLRAIEKSSFKDMSPEDVSNLSNEEYKKYIFFILAHESFHKIVIEIDHLYDKLGFKPMTDLPQGSH